MNVTEVYRKNYRAFKDGYRLIINKGGSRSSKSWSILQLLNTISEVSLKHIKTSIVSHSFPHLREGILYDFERLYAMNGRILSDYHNSSYHTIHINKSLINYFSADQSGKVMGPSRDILFLNEPNKGINFEHYVQLRQRTTNCIFLDYNPSSKFWLHTEKVLDEPNTIVLHSNWMDNIQNLTSQQIDDFIEAKRKAKISPYWAYWYKCYGEGEDAVLLEERVMPFVGRASKVPGDAVEIPSGVDFGFFPDPTCFIRLWIRPRKITGKMTDELYIQQIVYDTKLSINANGEGALNLCDILKVKGVNPKHHTIAESAEPRSINDMRSAGFSIEAVKKIGVEASIRLFHDYEIFIVDGSEQVFNEFDNFRYAKDPKTNEILGIPDKNQPDHGIAACRYVLMSRGMRWSV